MKIIKEVNPFLVKLSKKECGYKWHVRLSNITFWHKFK